MSTQTFADLWFNAACSWKWLVWPIFSLKNIHGLYHTAHWRIKKLKICSSNFDLSTQGWENSGSWCLLCRQCLGEEGRVFVAVRYGNEGTKHFEIGKSVRIIVHHYFSLVYGLSELVEVYATNENGISKVPRFLCRSAKSLQYLNFHPCHQNTRLLDYYRIEVISKVRRQRHSLIFL